MKRHSRRAFTLFQLLVVLALLAILFALLLPAVARVRQSAARIQSSNNLKQIGLACHAYHDTNNKLCPGVDDKHFSAVARLLPYMEQDNLFKQINFDKAADDKVNAPVRQVRIAILLAPNDPVPTVTAESGPTNYLFNAGSKPALKDNDGIFYHDSEINFAKITDGLSNTLFTGETLKGGGMTKPYTVQRHHVRLGADALESVEDETGVVEFKEGKKVVGDRCAAWIDGRFLSGTFTGTRTVNDVKPDVDCGGLGGLSGLRGLDAGLNVGFADGSVRFVTPKISLDTWKLLAGRDDGKAIPADF